VTADKVKVTTDKVKRSGSWHSYGVIAWLSGNPESVSDHILQ